MKELFPLNTFQQDAVLKRLDELKEISEDIVDGSEHLFENITDAQGHKRFIEGDIELDTNLPSGVTKIYGKWSLSGSHLLIVLVESVADTTVTTFQPHARMTIPKWIHDKLQTIYTDVVDRQVISYYSSDGANQNATGFLSKQEDNVLLIYINGLTFSADRQGRLQFDLIIDND